MTKYKYNIRCKACGHVTPAFHGWVFIKDYCSGVTVGYRSMLHDWEVVEDE